MVAYETSTLHLSWEEGTDGFKDKLKGTTEGVKMNWIVFKKMFCLLEAFTMRNTANWLSSFSVEGSERLWNKDPLTGILYQINSKSALTWHQARESCKQQNAELLSVTEIHEQTYLTGNDRTQNRK